MINGLVGGLGLLAYWGSSPQKNWLSQNHTKHSLASPVSSRSREAYWIEKTQNAWRAQMKKSQQVNKHLKNLGDEKVVVVIKPMKLWALIK